MHWRTYNTCSLSVLWQDTYSLPFWPTVIAAFLFHVAVLTVSLEATWSQTTQVIGTIVLIRTILLVGVWMLIMNRKHLSTSCCISSGLLIHDPLYLVSWSHGCQMVFERARALHHVCRLAGSAFALAAVFLGFCSLGHFLLGCLPYHDW